MSFSGWYYKALIVQGACVLLMLLSVLALKYFYKAEFKEVQKFYNDYIAVDTDINEVLK